MAQKNEITLTFEIKSSDPFDFKAKKELLEKLARLDSGKLNSLNKLSKADNTTLQNLTEITNSEKAVEKFNENFEFLKTFID